MLSCGVSVDLGCPAVLAAFRFCACDTSAASVLFIHIPAGFCKSLWHFGGEVAVFYYYIASSQQWWKMMRFLKPHIIGGAVQQRKHAMMEKTNNNNNDGNKNNNTLLKSILATCILVQTRRNFLVPWPPPFTACPTRFIECVHFSPKWNTLRSVFQAQMAYRKAGHRNRRNCNERKSLWNNENRSNNVKSVARKKKRVMAVADAVAAANVEADNYGSLLVNLIWPVRYSRARTSEANRKLKATALGTLLQKRLHSS